MDSLLIEGFPVVADDWHFTVIPYAGKSSDCVATVVLTTPTDRIEGSVYDVRDENFIKAANTLIARHEQRRRKTLIKNGEVLLLPNSRYSD